MATNSEQRHKNLVDYYMSHDDRQFAVALEMAYENLAKVAANPKHIDFPEEDKKKMAESIEALLEATEKRMGKNITPAEKGKFFTDRLTGNDAKLADLEAKTFVALKEFPGTEKGQVARYEQWRQDKEFVIDTKLYNKTYAEQPFYDVGALSSRLYVDGKQTMSQDKFNEIKARMDAHDYNPKTGNLELNQEKYEENLRKLEEERQKDTSLKQSKEEKLEDIYKRDRRDKKPVWGSKPNGEPIEEIIKNIEEERQKDASLKQTEKFDNKEALDQKKKQEEEDEEKKKRPQTFRGLIRGCYDAMRDARYNGKGAFGIIAAGLKYMFPPEEIKATFKEIKEGIKNGLKEMKDDWNKDKDVNPFIKRVAQACLITEDGRLIIKNDKDKKDVKNALDNLGFEYNESQTFLRTDDKNQRVTVLAPFIKDYDTLSAQGKKIFSERNEKIIESIRQYQTRLEERKATQTNNTGYKKADFSNSARPNSMGNEQTSANSLRDGFNALNERFGQKGKSTTPMPNTKQNSNTKQAPINNAAFNAAAAKKGQRI